MIDGYRITWSIDLTAASPREAAQQALEIQRDPHSLATEFEVHDAASGSISIIDLASRG